MNWCTIESDPGVFTELIRGMGVKNVQVEEILDLDDEETIKKFQPIYGLVFLFKWVKQTEPRECLEHYDCDLFFSNQVIQNACATQAIISILLNCKEIDIGEQLQNFKTFTKDFDSMIKGQTLSNSDQIRLIHNSFARPEPFEIVETKQPKNQKGEDIFHFISYIPFKGKVYELDGLQKGPIIIGAYQQNNWLEVAKKEIQARITKINQESEDLRFNLMAIVADRKNMATQQLELFSKQKLAYYNYMQSKGFELDGMMEADYNQLKATYSNVNLADIQIQQFQNKEELNQEIQICSNNITIQKTIIDDEDVKFEKYKIENIRRKHNYIPFILELLKLTTKKGKLNQLIDNAKQKRKDREEETKKKKEQDKIVAEQKK